jgi:hypothetical protein
MKEMMSRCGSFFYIREVQKITKNFVKVTVDTGMMKFKYQYGKYFKNSECQISVWCTFSFYMRLAAFIVCSFQCISLSFKSCYVLIDNYEVCEEAGANKQEARDNAAKRAVDILRENCYTIW